MLIAGGIKAPSFPLFSPENFPFEFLVVGDSLIWGQGLKEEHKFYTLTKEWLEREIFAQNRKVNLKVKAHSGATLTFHESEAEAFRKAGRDETKYYHPEINVGFPSVKTQIGIARKEYEMENKSVDAINLVMLSGGITDISVAGVLSPYGDNEKLKSDISKYCYGSMLEVLEHSAKTFPNALIAVIGYFPIISAKTRTGKLFNALLEAYNFPRPLKPVANNFLTKQFFKIVRKSAIERSLIWAELSDAKSQEAVNKLNADFGSRRALFVKAPITEETCFETKKTLLFRMGKKGKIEDDFFDIRKSECKPVLSELKNSTGLEYPVRFCEIAAVGHPNREGSKAFAEAIKEKLKPVLQTNVLGRN